MDAHPGPVPGVELGDLVGRGGFGTVFRGWEDEYDRLVAVKVLHRSDSGSEAAFRKELRAVGRAGDHPSVVTVLRHGLCVAADPVRGIRRGDAFLILQWADGGTLSERIASGTPFGFDWVRPVGEAIDHAHAKGLLHRDIKPSNILIHHDRPLLADFGIAKLLDPDVTTSTGVTTTVRYAAPELLKTLDATRAADIYAFAATIFHALVGHAPHCHDNPPAPVIRARRLREPVDISVLDGGLDPGSAEALARALSIDPDARPGSCADLVGELELDGVDSPLSAGQNDPYTLSLALAAENSSAPDGSRPDEADPPVPRILPPHLRRVRGDNDRAAPPAKPFRPPHLRALDEHMDALEPLVLPDQLNAEDGVGRLLPMSFTADGAAEQIQIPSPGSQDHVAFVKAARDFHDRFGPGSRITMLTAGTTSLGLWLKVIQPGAVRIPNDQVVEELGVEPGDMEVGSFVIGRVLNNAFPTVLEVELLDSEATPSKNSVRHNLRGQPLRSEAVAQFASRYTEGDTVRGEVVSMLSDKAFIKVDGVVAQVHAVPDDSDDWTVPEEIFSVGNTIECTVQHIERFREYEENGFVVVQPDEVWMSITEATRKRPVRPFSAVWDGPGSPPTGERLEAWLQLYERP